MKITQVDNIINMQIITINFIKICKQCPFHIKGCSIKTDMGPKEGISKTLPWMGVKYFLVK